MATKNEYVEKMQGQLDEWKAELKILEDKAEGATEEVKAQCCDAMDELRGKCAEGESKLEEWKSSAEDAWEDLQHEAEEHLTAFKDSAKETFDKIKSFFA